MVLAYFDRISLLRFDIFSGENLHFLVNLAGFSYFWVALYLSIRRVDPSYLIFSVLIMLPAMFSGTLTSWYRYMLSAWPIFIGPAIFISGKKYLAIGYLFFSGLVLVILASLFVRCFPLF